MSERDNLLAAAFEAEGALRALKTLEVHYELSAGFVKSATGGHGSSSSTPRHSGLFKME